MVLPNIIATGIYDSKVALKNTSVTKNRKTTMFEIELPITEAGISYINSGSTSISRNMIICAKPNQIRHTKLPYKCYYVHMIVDDEQLHNVLIKTQDFIFTKKYDYYEELFTRIIKYYNSLSNNEEIILQSLILELIYAITRDIYTNLNTKKSIKSVFLIENAIKYIKENLTEDLSLETISKKGTVHRGRMEYGQFDSQNVIIIKPGYSNRQSGTTVVLDYVIPEYINASEYQYSSFE